MIGRIKVSGLTSASHWSDVTKDQHENETGEIFMDLFFEKEKKDVFDIYPRREVIE